ncbi:monooxygenase [Streptomyces javensis]|uniref:FAD-dependent oxidoreductase n=1 Tax=Streptomyces javensis TaxID=114698 RepID=UPI0033C85BC7
MGPVGRHAVVIGGSMGGLVAARALADRFERVTVLDRDTLPDEPHTRRAVPHGGHAHALLIRGLRALEQLFPGLGDELVGAGAVRFDPGQDLLFYQMGGLRARFNSGKLGISLSRALLEYSVRCRVVELANVTVRDRTNVVGLTGGVGRIRGVVVEGGEVLDTDLVVNATGRGGGGPDGWLEGLGCAAPEVDTVKIDVGYTTRIFHRHPGDLHEGGLLYLMSAIPPHDKRAAAVFAIEGNRWMVTLGGWHKAHAPVDPAGFEKFATDLRAPHVAELLRRAEPVDDGDARRFTFPAARRRYFERLRELPSGFVALGDAICSFNPLYGQGMTVAALEALQLGHCLDQDGSPSAEMARRYYRLAGKVIDTPWQMATGGDFIYPETQGPKPPGIKLINWYVKQAMRASQTSIEVHRVMLNMQHLLAPPSAIMRPANVFRALRAARRARHEG